MKYICFQIYLELIETFISYFEKKKVYTPSMVTSRHSCNDFLNKSRKHLIQMFFFFVLVEKKIFCYLKST